MQIKISEHLIRIFDVYKKLNARRIKIFYISFRERKIA